MSPIELFWTAKKDSMVTIDKVNIYSSFIFLLSSWSAMFQQNRPKFGLILMQALADTICTTGNKS